MKVSQKVTNGLLLFFTPVITGLSISTSASLAATLALSESQFSLYNFTHAPQGTATFADTNANTFSSSGVVSATGNALAVFLTTPFTIAQNQSDTLALGTGQEYTGMAESLTAVRGENFLVGANETFSFDFAGFLGLYTSIDSPPSEGASSDGSISFQLYNSITHNLLDYFVIGGHLVTPESGDFLGYNKSDHVTFNPNAIYFGNNFGGNQEIAIASLQGNYSRTFDSLTYLTLVEVKTNRSNVKAPEPSATLALLLFSILAMSYGTKNKLTNGKTQIK